MYGDGHSRELHFAKTMTAMMDLNHRRSGYGDAAVSRLMDSDGWSGIKPPDSSHICRPVETPEKKKQVVQFSRWSLKYAGHDATGKIRRTGLQITLFRSNHTFWPFETQQNEIWVKWDSFSTLDRVMFGFWPHYTNHYILDTRAMSYTFLSLSV